MKTKDVGLGLLIGGILTAPLIGLMYAGNQIASLPFVPFDVFDWMTRVLPGPVITFGIDTMIDLMRLVGLSVADTAKTSERIIAVVQFFGIGTVLAALTLVFLQARRATVDRMTGFFTGLLFGLPMIAISIAISQSAINPLISITWLLVLFLSWGLAFSSIYKNLEAEKLSTLAVEEKADDHEAVAQVEHISRKQFLIRLGVASAAITVVGSGVGAALARSFLRDEERALDDSMAHLSEGSSKSPFPNANDPVSPAPGTRPEYTPIKDHYKVFLRTDPTRIEEAGWLLPITGLVDNPLMLTLDDIKNNFESRDQYVTLSCISGRVGTTLISTTQWTGVSMQDILAEAQVQPGAKYLHITSGDGFYETVDLDLIASDERIMLCYEWDGNALPFDHGFPVRIWIPDRYGMKQPKWITGMEIMDEFVEGYWVERNWDLDAIVRTTSVIDTVAVDALVQDGGQTRVPVGGIAFSGDKQISKVEVRVDGGPWEEAQLRAPLSETTWVIWRYDWLFTEGEHTFEVRCAEGDGTPQIEEESDNRPKGATGIHSREASLPSS